MSASIVISFETCSDAPEDFPWCGLLIHMKDLSIMADYSKLRGIRECRALHFARAYTKL